MRERNEHDTGDASVVDRRLTVTYYVDPLHLRTVSIPVRRVNALLATLTVTILWGAGAATYFGYALYAMLSRDQDSAPAVASFDSVLDGSAAESSVTGTPGAAAPLPEAAMPEVALPELPTPLAEPVAPEPVAPEPVAPVAVTPPVEAPAPQLAVATLPTRGRVMEPKVTRAGRNLNVRFAIVNHGDGAAAGRVWGVAEYRTTAGEVRRIASHPGIDVGVPRAVGNMGAGLTYKARRRADKSLAFALPQDQSGDVEAISIFTGERDGAAISETKINVQP
jgi:hypothetical protein